MWRDSLASPGYQNEPLVANSVERNHRLPTISPTDTMGCQLSADFDGARRALINGLYFSRDRARTSSKLAFELRPADYRRH